MERITKRDGLLVRSKFKEEYGSQTILHALADYEDAEEQGLLVKIECRCKDCVYADFAGCSKGTCYCLKHESYMEEDDFCKRAEKYEEEAEA